MLYANLVVLAIFNGVLVAPFRIADAQPGHHQVMVRACMAQDGRFAVAWVDSLVNPSRSPDKADYWLFVRFFDEDGVPLTDAWQAPKVADTNRIYWPELAMDSAGNTVLAWTESLNRWGDDPHLRFQLFDRAGTPVDSPHTITDKTFEIAERPLAVSRSRDGEFAVVWDGEHSWINAQRFRADGTPKGEAFLAHAEYDTSYHVQYMTPGVALNNNGDLVVTWANYARYDMVSPRYEVFDSLNSPLLPWDTLWEEGKLVIDPCPYYVGSRSEVYWLDNNSFVVFWVGGSTVWLNGRVFTDKGLVRHPIRNLVLDGQETDSLLVFAMWDGQNGWFSSALDSQGRFSLTHTRRYAKTNDTIAFLRWYHQAGALGAIEDYEPHRQTALFEYSPPYGADTASIGIIDAVQPPAVACNDGRLLWVYSRFNTDTFFEAYALVTDWDMGSVISEPPVTHLLLPDFEITLPISPTVTLRYSNCAGGFQASVYDAGGRRVDKISTPNQSGTLSWGKGKSSGVYFIVSEKGSKQVEKVILVK